MTKIIIIKIMCFMLHTKIIIPSRPWQRKVLSLVLAIIHEPKLIIFDDITSGMDNETLKK
jgi:ABC-type Na+ transport system ATPase subunit NatA